MGTISSNGVPESTTCVTTVVKKEPSSDGVDGREEPSHRGSSSASSSGLRQLAGVDNSFEDDSLVIDWGSTPPDSRWDEAASENQGDGLRPIVEVLPPSPISQDAIPEAVSEQEEDPPRPFISRTRSRQLIVQNRAEIRAAAASERLRLSQVHLNNANDHISGVHNQPAVRQMVIPFYIHPSHEALYCGGFVACTVCGHTNSRPGSSQLPAKLSTVCVPAPNGGKKADSTKGLLTRFQIVKKLREEGKIPYRYLRWPDGSPPDLACVPSFLERDQSGEYRREVPQRSLPLE